MRKELTVASLREFSANTIDAATDARRCFSIRSLFNANSEDTEVRLLRGEYGEPKEQLVLSSTSSLTLSSLSCFLSFAQ